MHICWNLSVIFNKSSWGGRLVHRHAETAYTHTLPLQNSIYQTLDGVLKKYVADVAYLRITLSSHTRIQHEAMAAKLFHYTLILSSSDYCGCVGGEVFVEKLGVDCLMFSLL